MECCTKYDRIFDQKYANKNLKRYRKKGLEKSSQQVVDFLKGKINGWTVLEIGGGLGYLGMELVKNGAQSALEIDISNSYLNKAKLLRSELGLDDSVDFKIMDFIEHYRDLSDQDIVVSDKVICCLPNYQEFIEAGTTRAKKYYALVYPRESGIYKVFGAVLNWFSQFLNKYKGFKFFIHSHRDINNLITQKGFTKVFDTRKGVWRISIYAKK